MRLKLKTPDIFYGWWIVSACFLISLYVGGVIVYGFTAFFEPIANEFGWSYTQVSLAASLRGVELGLLAPFAGLIVDRWGPRRLLFGGTILIGLGLFLVSRTTSLGMFYGGFAIIAVGVSGCSSTVVFTAVANWFRKKVGIASGIMASGLALGALLVPLVVKLIDMFDWQTAMVIFGIGIPVIGLPLSLLVRHKPEQYGYLPDGEKLDTITSYQGPISVQTVDVDITAKQAIASRPFWHVAVAMACQYLAITAVIAHIMPYLSSVGIVRSTSSVVATVFPTLSIGGRLGFGWLCDRFDKRWIATGGIATICICLLFFSYVSSDEIWLLVPFIILFSIGYGGQTTARVTMLREYFGRRKFGTIHGLVMGILGLGNLAGPVLAGWVFDNWGSYHYAWLSFACLAFIAVIIMVTAPPTHS